MKTCPSCRQELKPVPTRDGWLEHYWCGECRTIWAYYPTPGLGNGFLWEPCEDPQRHLPEYVSEPLMKKIGGGAYLVDQDPQTPALRPQNTPSSLTPSPPPPPQKSTKGARS